MLKLVLSATIQKEAKKGKEESFNLKEAVDAIWSGAFVKKVLKKFEEKGPFSKKDAKDVGREVLQKLEDRFISRYDSDEWDQIKSKLLTLVVRALPVK